MFKNLKTIFGKKEHIVPEGKPTETKKSRDTFNDDSSVCSNCGKSYLSRDSIGTGTNAWDHLASGQYCDCGSETLAE